MSPTARTDLARACLAEIRRREQLRAAARSRLYEYIRQSWIVTNPGTTFEDAKHIEVVADHVQTQLEEWAQACSDPTFVARHQDLLINIPPRCLKSTIVAVCATTWAWLHWPHLKIGCLSTNPRVSFRDALAARTLITSDWYQTSFRPEWSIREDQGAIGSFANTMGGSRIARGLESNVVGEGFDWIIIDDPHDPRDSSGAVETTIMGWDQAVSSRVSDARRSIRTGIMQAVREGDFSEHVRKQGWGWLCLPMEFEAEHVVPWPYPEIGSDWRKVDGEILQPERFPPRVLEQRRLELGPYGWAAQMQQRPAPLGGGMLKAEWFKRFTLTELMVNGRLDVDWMTISVDPTGNAANDGDNVGLIVAGGKGPCRYVFEDASRKMTFLETCAAIRVLLATYPTCRKVLVEKSVLGPAIVEQLRKEVNQGALRVVVIEELTTHMHGKKEQRALAMVPQLAAGLVYLLDGAGWIPAFVGELSLFPNGQHDDRVDALAQLLTFYAEKSGVDRLRALNGLGGMLSRAIG